MVRILIALSFTLQGLAYGQCLSINYSAPTQVCQFENVELSTSTPAALFEWDFCINNLNQAPTLSQPIAQTTNSRTQDVTKVFDGTSHYLFTAHDNTNSVVRVKLGSNVKSSTPQIQDLGNVGGVLLKPISIDIFEWANNWYAVVYCSQSRNLILLTFGSSLDNAPTGSIIYSSIGDANTAISVMIASSPSIILVEGNRVKQLTFSNGLSSAPTYTELTTAISLGIDVRTINTCAGWVAFVLDYNTKQVYRVNFDSGQTVQSVTLLNGIIPISDPYRFDLVSESGRYHMFVSNISGSGLVRYDLGNDINNVNPSITNTGLSIPQGWTITVLSQQGIWTAFSPSANTGVINRLDFPNACPVSQNWSNQASPTSIQFTQSGNFEIGLTLTESSGISTSTIIPITVTAFTSPDVDFQMAKSCTLEPTTFTSVNSSGNIASYLWEFGDGSTSNQPLVNYPYATKGTYDVSLTLTSNNGCKNKETKTMVMADKPIANFSLPLGLICTNQELVFENTSGFDPNLDFTWGWYLNGVLVSNDEDFVHSFSTGTASSQPITLKAETGVTACNAEITQNISSVQIGPLLSFNFTGACMTDIFSFTNTTIDPVVNLAWDFGDGNTSGLTSPIHTYLSSGQFPVTLMAESTNGCRNSVTQNVPVRSIPQPNFFIDLPPFSCSGSPTQFHDATPPPTDGNITSWKWTFGDGVATSIQQNPLHTYNQSGSYSVKLEVESNFGCAGTEEHDIFIAETPTADFTIGPACLNLGTQFQSLSVTGIQSWQWAIGNSAYSFANPTHTFTQPGSYQAMLVVVGENSCEALAMKTVVVNNTPQLDFINSIACSGQETVFTDQSTGSDLPQTWNWVIDGHARTGMPADHTFETAGAKSVQMNVITVGGCQYSVTKNVIVAPSPMASFTASSVQGAPPLQVQFINNSQDASTYTWNFGLSNATSTLNSPQFTFNALGDYLVELIATNNVGCSDTHTEVIHVLVPNYNLTLESISVHQNASSKSIIVSITNNSNLLVSGTDIWLTGSSGLRIKTNININLAAHATGEFSLPLEISTPEAYLCVELAPTNDTNASDNQRCENLLNAPALIAPYPNPTKGLLWFDVVLDEALPAKLLVSDVLGQQVFNQEFSGLNQGLNRIEINLSGQRPGLYLAIWEVAGLKHEFTFVIY